MSFQAVGIRTMKHCYGLGGIKNRLDEGEVGSGMGLFLIVGHWPKILRKTQKELVKCVYCVGVLCTVYAFPSCC